MRASPWIVMLLLTAAWISLASASCSGSDTTPQGQLSPEQIAQDNRTLDEIVVIMEKSKILMKFDQFGDHAECYVNPSGWAQADFEMKKTMGRALYRKSGEKPVYIFDGFSGKKLARQGPRGLDIE